MYEKKVGRAYGRGCLLSCGVMVVGAVFGTLLVGTVLVIIRGGDVEPRSPRLALALLVPIVFMAVPWAIAAVVVLARSRRLDRAFAPWGVRGRQAGAVMRSWHGEIGGRSFDAWFHKGPTLELYLGCEPATRAVIRRAGRLASAFARAFEAREPISPPPLDLAGVSVVAEDEDWMRRLLSRSAAAAAVTALLEESPRAAALVFVAPDAVRYVRRFMPVSEVEPDNLRTWLADLERLAAAVDAVGPSPTAVRPTRLETWARTARDRFLNAVLLGLAAFFVFVLGALFLFAFLNVGTP